LAETKKSKTRKPVIIVVGIWIGVCLGGLLIVGLVLGGVIPITPADLGIAPEPFVIEESDAPAPVFEVQDINGEMVRLTDFEGNVVVLNFWATWCAPCVREMPLFQKYHDQVPDIVVLGVNEEEPVEKVREFIEKTGFTYRMLLDTDVVMGEAYYILTLPTTVFIDKQGIMRYRHIGYMSEEQFEFYLTELGVME